MGDSREFEFDARLSRAWRDDHRYLLNVAFRVLGSISEAEDTVQEAFARLVEQDLDEIDDVRGWLTVVVSRLCFDRLRSADRQRRSSTTLHTFEPPLARDMDPADRITLDDEVRLALHIVMTQLTPAERIAFVLHDVFSYSFDAISEILGRSPATSMANESGWARRDVKMSTSMPVQPPIAARSSSVGVNSASSPVPNEIRPPRSLAAQNRPAPVRSTAMRRGTDVVLIALRCPIGAARARSVLPRGAGCVDERFGPAHFWPATRRSR